MFYNGCLECRLIWFEKVKKSDNLAVVVVGACWVNGVR